MKASLAEVNKGEAAEKELCGVSGPAECLKVDSSLRSSAALCVRCQVLSSRQHPVVSLIKGKEAANRTWQSNLLHLILIYKMLLSIHIILSSNTYSLKL